MARIPMSSTEVPPQGYRIDIPLPPRPKELESRSCDLQAGGDIIPGRMPPSAKLLGQFEWAWSPMNNAIAELHLSLNKPKTLWIVWLGLYNDNETPWHWERQIWLVAPHGKEHRDTAAVHLLMDGLQALRDDWGYDRFHWINSGGALGVHRLEEIGDQVWAG